MKAMVGDRIRVNSRHVGEPHRDGEVVDVRGHGGEPPFLVRWDADGHEGLFFPGPDVHVEHLGAAAPEPVGHGW